MKNLLRSALEWLDSYWTTYVLMSRAERRRLIAILDELDEPFTPDQWIQVDRP